MSGFARVWGGIWKMVILVTIGVVALALLDVLQSHLLDGLLLEHVLSNREQHAQRDRIQLDHIIKGFHQSIQVVSHHKGFADYVERVADNEWAKEQPVHVTIHRHPPSWFPANSVVRTFLPTRHAILLDGENRVRELYQHLRQTPSALLPPSPLLLQLSRGDTFMTYLDEGIPYVLTSDTVRRRSGRLLATLVFATPMDDQFLASLQARRPKDGSILVLFDSQENPVVLTSSDISTVSPGESLEQLRKKYHVSNLDIFDYGSSDLLIQFASLTGKKEVQSLVTAISSREHLLRLLSNAILVMLLIFIMVWMRRRIARAQGGLSSRLGKVLGEAEENSTKPLEQQIDLVAERLKNTDQTLADARQVDEDHRSLLQSLILNVDDAIIVINEQGVIQLFNLAAEKMFGWPQSDMVGHSLHRLMGDTLWERHCQSLLQFTPDHFSHMVGERVEVTALRADGSSFPLELKVSYSPLATGGRFIGVMNDLTSQKQLAITASLRQSERLYRDVLERAEMAVLILNREGHILFCNDYLLSLTRFSRHEVLGSVWWEHFLPSDQHLITQKFFQHAATLVDSGFTYHAFESQILLKGGESRLFNWNVLMLRDEENVIVCQAMMGHDLTWLRKIEREMEKAREETLQAHRDKNYYLSRMNHEIRSPLNAIVGFVDILRQYRQQLPEDMVDFLDYIEKSSRDLVELLNNVLDYARLEEGHMGLVMEEVNPRLLVQGAYHLHKPEALRKALAYTYHLDESLPPTLYSDRTLLNRILLGLLVVAIHGVANGGRVMLRAQREDNWFCLEVEDDGPQLPNGMGDSLYHQLEEWEQEGMQRFSQCPMALTLVKKAVDKLQGRLSHFNLPHQGLSFQVRIPLTKHPEEEEEYLPVPFSPGQRVVVVISGPANGQMMNSMLRQMGVEPMVTQSLAQAAILPGVAQAHLLITEEGDTKTVGLEHLPTLLILDQEPTQLPDGVIGGVVKPVDRLKLYSLMATVLSCSPMEEEIPSSTLADMSPAQVEEIVMLLDDLAAIPLYRAETIVSLSREIKHRTASFRTALPTLCDAIVDAVHGRNSIRVPDLVNEAQTILDNEYGHHSYR